MRYLAILLLCPALAFAQWTTDTNGSVYLGTATAAGASDFTNPTAVIRGAIQLQRLSGGPSWGDGVCGMAMRATGELVEEDTLVMRCGSYHFETLRPGGIKSGLIIDNNSNVWIGTDFGNGKFFIRHRLEVDGAAVIGNGFQSKNHPGNGPENGLAVEGNVAIGAKAVTPYGTNSKNLVVQGAGNANLQLLSRTGTDIGVVQMNASFMEFYIENNQGFRFSTPTKIQMIIDPSGLVTLPQYKNCKSLSTDSAGNLLCN